MVEVYLAPGVCLDLAAREQIVNRLHVIIVNEPAGHTIRADQVESLME